MDAKTRLAEETFESLDAMIAAYARGAIEVAWNEHRQRLDFSVSSIERLERILDGQSTEDLEFQTRLWGSYFGEVIRRQFAGDWELAQYPGGGVSLVPTLVIRGSRLYPLIKVFRRLTMGPAESLPAFYAMAASRLDPPSFIQ